MKRVITVILVLSLLIGMAAIPAAAEAADPASISGELVFWTQDNEVWSNWFQPAIEGFRQKYPNITIKDEYFPTFADKMTQAYSAGQQPDVAQTWQGVNEWAKAGKLLPVPDSLGLAANYLQGALESKAYEGAYYCVPSEINIESPSLFVNMDLLAQEGVELPEGWIENNGPKNWAELFELAKKLTKIDSGMVMQSGLAYCYAQWEATFASLIWQNGGDYRDAANGVVHFDTPEARAALEFLLKYCDPSDPDCISDRGNSRYDLFVQGAAAMCVGAPWYAGGFNTDCPGMNYQVFNMPAMVEGSDPYCMATGGWGYIVSAECKYPEAAWAFIEYMNNPENNGDWALSCGTLPARKDAVMNLDYDPSVGSVEKALSIAQDVLIYGQEDGAYTLSPSKLIYNIVRLQLQQVMETGDIDTALKTMEQQGNDMISENLNR